MKNDTKNFIRANAIQIMGILMLILNLWLSTKLFPLAQGLRDNEFAIKAISDDYARKSTVDTGFQHVGDSIDSLNNKVDKINDKLDKILGF